MKKKGTIDIRHLHSFSEKSFWKMVDGWEERNHQRAYRLLISENQLNMIMRTKSPLFEIDTKGYFHPVKKLTRLDYDNLYWATFRLVIAWH